MTEEHFLLGEREVYTGGKGARNYGRISVKGRETSNQSGQNAKKTEGRLQSTSKKIDEVY